MRASALLVLANRDRSADRAVDPVYDAQKDGSGLAVADADHLLDFVLESRIARRIGLDQLAGALVHDDQMVVFVVILRSGSNISGRLFMQRLRVCAKDGMFGFELAEGEGRSSRPYRFLYIRRNGSSVKNEPFVGRRGRIPFRFLQVRRDFRRRTRTVCVVLSARAGRKRRCLGCMVRSA